MYAKRYDTKSGRFYEKIDNEGNSQGFFKSVTEILSATEPPNIGLLKYYGQRGYDEAVAYRDERAHQGTALHVAIRKFLEGHTVDTRLHLMWDEMEFSDEIDIYLDPFENPKKTFEWTEEAVHLFRGAVAWLIENREVVRGIRGIEQPVFSTDPALPVAGMIDLVFQVGDQLSVLDWKATTAIQHQHEVQVSTYAELYEQEHGVEVHNAMIARMYRWKTKPTVQIKVLDRNRIEQLYQEFWHRFHSYLLGGGTIDFEEPEPIPRVFEMSVMLEKLEEQEKRPDLELNLGGATEERNDGTGAKLPGRAGGNLSSQDHAG